MHPSFAIAIVLRWMNALVPAESVPWGDTYPSTSVAISHACGAEIRCMATLTAIGYHESRFNPSALGDHNQSVGVWQVSKYWKPGKTVHEQAVAAARLVEQSFHVCKAKPLAERLGWYAKGGSGCGAAGASRIRMALAKRLTDG